MPLYLVSEGDVYSREDAPDHMRGWNFGDWAIFEAADEATALNMAQQLDAAANYREGKTSLYRKYKELASKRLEPYYADLKAFEWLDAMSSLRFSPYGFKSSAQTQL